MKKITLTLSIIFLITACSSSKRTETAISKGDYDSAIRLAVKKLRKSTSKKKKQHLIVMLVDAYNKAVEKDIKNIARFKQDTSTAIIESIYKAYITLDKRQELIKPILPLYIKNKSRNAQFTFTDYNQNIKNAKKTLVNYLYQNALELLNSNTKINARNAYRDLAYLDKINPNYKDASQLLEEAHYKGTNFVEVNLINDTNQIIPKRLEEDLLNFNAYGLDQFWTVYHSNKNQKTDYTYKLELLFRQINISPERFVEKQILLEKEIKDGFEYVLDRNGNVSVDSLGNSIKIDKYISVKADYFELHQEKATHIEAEIILTDLKTNQEIDVIPIESEFVFIHDFAEMSGDIRALNYNQKQLIKIREIPFPNTEQMIFDTGEDLKNKLKNIIEDLEI